MRLEGYELIMLRRSFGNKPVQSIRQSSISEGEVGRMFQHIDYLQAAKESAEQTIAELKKELSESRATNERLNRRAQAMESKHPERFPRMLAPDQSLRLEIVRLHKELVAAHEGARVTAWINRKRLDEIAALKAELQSTLNKKAMNE